MSTRKSTIVAAGLLSLVACSADSGPGPQTDEGRGVEPSSVGQPLAVEPAGCSAEWLPDIMRGLQTDATNLIWAAAYEYMENPWSELAIRSFGTPDQGQYDIVNDTFWTLTLGLDADRGFDQGVVYECNETGHPMCASATTLASVDRRRDPDWRVHLCPYFFELPNIYGSELNGDAYQYQRAALIHEYFHLVGRDDSGGYCSCALDLAAVNPKWAAGNADNYQLFVTGLAGVKSVCELPRVGC